MRSFCIFEDPDKDVRYIKFFKDIESYINGISDPKEDLDLKGFYDCQNISYEHRHDIKELFKYEGQNKSDIALENSKPKTLTLNGKEYQILFDTLDRLQTDIRIHDLMSPLFNPLYSVFKSGNISVGLHDSTFVLFEYVEDENTLNVINMASFCSDAFFHGGWRFPVMFRISEIQRLDDSYKIVFEFSRDFIAGKKITFRIVQPISAESYTQIIRRFKSEDYFKKRFEIHCSK